MKVRTVAVLPEGILAREPVELTATEYGVLNNISSQAGMVLTDYQLLSLVQGVAHSGNAKLDRTNVRRLRQELGDDADSPRYVLTAPNVGYRKRRDEHGRRWSRHPGGDRVASTR